MVKLEVSVNFVIRHTLTRLNTKQLKASRFSEAVLAVIRNVLFLYLVILAMGVFI